jgi:hypothetical protein
MYAVRARALIGWFWREFQSASLAPCLARASFLVWVCLPAMAQALPPLADDAAAAFQVDPNRIRHYTDFLDGDVRVPMSVSVGEGAPLLCMACMCDCLTPTIAL